jgi:hypothetical protein
MTNFDIDEIIFPRFYNTKLAEYLDKNNKTDCKKELYFYSKSIHSHKFNIYELAKKLTTINGKNSAYFEFSHFLVLNDQGYITNVESRVSGYKRSHEFDSSVPSLKDEIGSAPSNIRASAQIETPVSPAAIRTP